MQSQTLALSCWCRRYDSLLKNIVLLSLAVLVFITYCYFWYFWYPIFLALLSKALSAHLLATLTSLWAFRKRYLDREMETIKTAHEKYGPDVRLGPEEISVNWVNSGLRAVHYKGLEKPRWYSFFTNYGYGTFHCSLHF